MGLIAKRVAEQSLCCVVACSHKTGGRAESWGQLSPSPQTAAILQVAKEKPSSVQEFCMSQKAALSFLIPKGTGN